MIVHIAKAGLDAVEDGNDISISGVKFIYKETLNSGIEDGSCNQDIGHKDKPEHENQDDHRGHETKVHESVRIGVDIDGKEVSDGAHDHHDQDGSW